ncbi:hypothetical protein ABNB59_19050 [Paenibacillus larvae]|uniref:Uncharacterized protein n=2 Tax=Paenibacillus larvae TaxID=1464 RepID=V9W2T0_9BACL|nr:hypothetical protein [Paenibacillus larvae]AHD04453.1 hypothetical protein ERIC2_c06110 [Paenibacillus larvae subsp. larvae DSM 25430]MCY7478286.1 hypothetical protein [Paenibacillus larvae]MCY7491925.1 hypothetical protein [Paenibacillus larvae]MCY9565253.1 hypothetical protein [Paenibacillus larvae]MCY9569170.1 hypothetical protein [Paenibacillus larvae]
MKLLIPYDVAGLVGGYLILSGFLWKRNIWQFIALLYVVSAGVLFALDHLQGGGSRFFPIALPIATLAILPLALLMCGGELAVPKPLKDRRSGKFRKAFG